MSWAEAHRESEILAAEAEELLRGGDIASADVKFAAAAAHEEAALLQVDLVKTRTWAITAISAASLWFKGHNYRSAEKLALGALSNDDLPPFASDQLSLILQTIWTERASNRAGVNFLPGQVVVGIDGGQIIRGAAPLDLVVSKVQTIQALFYRTIELIRDMPHRARGGPIREIQEACRPWLLQAPPGSYQFSVAIQEPAQKDFFKETMQPSEVAHRFLEVLKAAGSDNQEQLAAMVPDPEYRSTFMKLTRNLAPTGRTFSKMEIRTATERSGVVLLPENRTTLNKALRKQSGEPDDAREVTYSGVLRGVHLDKDWLELQVEGRVVHVVGLKDTLDDVIGPMVNHPVVVRATAAKAGSAPQFIDIELDD